MITNAELKELLHDLESDRSERKESLADKQKIYRAICSFANDYPDNRRPGIIFINVDDKGNFSDFKITDQVLRELADMRSNGKIIPFPEMTVQKALIDGVEVAVVEVKPSINPPIRYDGRVWIRVGPSCRQAGPEEERRLSEKRRSLNLPFDHQSISDSSMKDLDLEWFHKEYLPNAIARDVLEANQRTLEQRLQSLRFIDSSLTPTVAALLVFGKNTRQWFPGAYVQFLRLDGRNITDSVINEKEIDGPIPEVLRNLEELLSLNIATSADFKNTVKEIRKPDYPIVAFQQVCRNAILHRAYDQTYAPVKVYWFTDRVEVHSPGGLFGQVTVENLGKGATDYRNPLLAEVLKALGYVQRFGAGIPLANAELEKNGNPKLDYKVENNSVLTVIRKAL